MLYSLEHIQPFHQGKPEPTVLPCSDKTDALPDQTSPLTFQNTVFPTFLHHSAAHEQLPRPGLQQGNQYGPSAAASRSSKAIPAVHILLLLEKRKSSPEGSAVQPIHFQTRFFPIPINSHKNPLNSFLLLSFLYFLRSSNLCLLSYHNFPKKDTGNHSPPTVLCHKLG